MPLMQVNLRKNWFANSNAVRPNVLQVVRGLRYRAGIHKFPFDFLDILPSSAEIVAHGPSGFKGKVGDWRKVKDDFPPVAVKSAPGPNEEEPDEDEDEPDEDEDEPDAYVDPRKENDIDRTSAEHEAVRLNQAAEDDLKAKAEAFQAQLEAEMAGEGSRDTKPARKRSK